MISKKEQKRRQHGKELNSLRNKMGDNIIWFDALNKNQQYDLLFRWKEEKFKNKLESTQKKIIKRKIYGGFKKIEVISYPTNFKYFIKNIKHHFSISILKMRESKLKHILN
jgi:hypothetical protein